MGGIGVPPRRARGWRIGERGERAWCWGHGLSGGATTGGLGQRREGRTWSLGKGGLEGGGQEGEEGEEGEEGVEGGGRGGSGGSGGRGGRGGRQRKQTRERRVREEKKGERRDEKENERGMTKEGGGRVGARKEKGGGRAREHAGGWAGRRTMRCSGPTCGPWASRPSQAAHTASGWRHAVRRGTRGRWWRRAPQPRCGR